MDAAQSIIPYLVGAGFAPDARSIHVYHREPHPAQARVLSEMKRFNTASCGRRFGKTHMCVDWVVEPATRRGLPVAWFAPTFKMVEEVFSDVVNLIGKENIESSNRQKGRIELKNGGKIDFWSLEAAPTLRGRKYARIVVDEAAHVTCDLQSVWEKVIGPTLTDYKGEAFFISTPNGYNFFRTLYERGEDPNYPDWMSWQLPTTDNPYIDPAEVERAKEEIDDQSYRQEYLAEFLRDEGKVFRNVEANLIATENAEPSGHAGHKIVAGVDWAQIKDFTVNSIGCSTCKTELFLDRFNQIEFHVQRRRLVEEWKRWNVSDVYVEENSIGKPNYEELIRESIVTANKNHVRVRLMRLTSESKPKLVQDLALSLEKEQFKFLPSVAGKNEFLSYEAKVSPTSGNIRYSAPSGGHDDIVIARALMLKNVLRGGRARMIELAIK